MSGAWMPGELGESVDIETWRRERATRDTTWQPLSMEEPTSYLPAPLSTFIGRETDLAEVTALLVDPAIRLLTLTGPGGIGKTRLAIAAASAAADHFSDGVAFIALETVRRADQVLPALAQAFGLREHGAQSRREQLRIFLRARKMLLVLDNVEQVLEAAPELAALLAAAPGVTALVTSRAPLRVDGERELPLAPLTTARTQATVAEILASDAGRLFVERARARQPAFVLDEESAPVVAEICARLDGLPLAIELAAARLNVLSLPLLRDRLDRRLPLLTRGDRAAPARHGAMRDAIAWSYDLLSPVEQTLFRYLSVFAGGFTLEAAEYVGEDGLKALGGDAFGLGGEVDEVEAMTAQPQMNVPSPLHPVRPVGPTPPEAKPAPPKAAQPPSPPPSVLDLVASLVEQSLLGRGIGLDGQPRLHMLETIREFGLEQLAAKGEEHEARARHARALLAMARTRLPLASVRARHASFDWLTAEQANLRAALSWLEEHGPAANHVALAAFLGLSWYAYRDYREGQHLLERALPRLEQAPLPDQARLLIGYAGVLFGRGEFSRMEPILVRALESVHDAGEPLDRAVALMLRGATWNSEGKYPAAEAALREALALADHLDDPLLRAAVASRAFGNLSVSALGQQDYARATAFGEEALRLCDGSHLDIAEAMALLSLGATALAEGNHALAAARLFEGVGLLGEQGDPRVIADAVSEIACVATAAGKQRPALLLFGAADAVRSRVGAAMLWPSDIAAVERNLAALRETLGEEQVATILAEGRGLSFAEMMAIASTVAQPEAASTKLGSGLTRREREVLRLLAEQRTDREIADALFLSRRTVNWHVRSILAKLGATSRGNAVARARAAGMI